MTPKVEIEEDRRNLATFQAMRCSDTQDAQKELK